MTFLDFCKLVAIFIVHVQTVENSPWQQILAHGYGLVLTARNLIKFVRMYVAGKTSRFSSFISVIIYIYEFFALQWKHFSFLVLNIRAMAGFRVTVSRNPSDHILLSDFPCTIQQISIISTGFFKAF